MALAAQNNWLMNISLKYNFVEASTYFVTWSSLYILSAEGSRACNTADFKLTMKHPFVGKHYQDSIRYVHNEFIQIKIGN